MNVPNIPVGWFDFFAAVILMVGLVRGRKRGMSEEILDLIPAILMVVVAGYFYKPVSQFIQDFTKLPIVVTHVSAYIAIAGGIKGLFAILKRITGEKLFGSDTFGRLEYPLGALSGMARWACGLIICISLLSAKSVSEAENVRRIALANEELGKDYFAIFDIGWHQQSIFKKSYIGPHIEKYLGPFLIEGQSINIIPTGDNNWKGKKEREYEEMMKGGGKK